MDHSVTVTEKDGVHTIQFVVYLRPWTTNAERSGNRFVRATKTAEWRQLYGALGRTKRFPCLTNAIITVGLSLKGRQQDCGACNPAVKAAIDGIVDSGILLDDTPEHLAGILFLAPVKAKYDRIVISVVGRQHDHIPAV